MINGEGWLKIPKDKTCDLTVIPLLHYTRKTKYELPIAPSPNLRSTAAIEWYPSLCLFEGTVISVGRGTDNPFTLFGCPDCQLSGTIFTPQPNHGSSAPKYQGEACKGISMLRTSKNKLLDVATWLQAYQSYQGEKPYFNAFFKKLAGNNLLQEQISQGQSENR